MGFFSRFICLCAVTFWLAALSLRADDATPTTAGTNDDLVTAAAIIQLQAQLQEARTALENESKNNSELLAERIQSLEQTMATQHAADMESARKTQQFTLIFCGLLAGACLLVLLLLAYFQWRAMTHLIELSTQPAGALPLGNGSVTVTAPSVGQMAAAGRMAVENSNSRLLGSVERLEQRISEMERAARAALPPTVEVTAPKPAMPPANGHAAAAPAAARPAPSPAPAAPANDRDECVANLIAEGQSLLNHNESVKALECFDTALNLQPNSCEALVKKGTALERLGQLDEALACYDQAIKTGATTIAYLQKGGLLNRMARYDDALKCYEFALQAQDKKG